MQRCHKKGWVDTPVCPACGEEEETEQHIFDHCAGYRHIRHREVPEAIWNTLPDCLRLRGLFPADWQFQGATEQDHAAVADLTCRVQYTLMDILIERRQHLPASMHPQPRWQRVTRRRIEVPAPAAGRDQPAPAFVPGGQLRTIFGEHLQ